MWQKVTKDKRFWGVGVLLLVIAALPVTLGLMQEQQDIRQRAATTGQVCATDQATDTMMIIDRSGSMSNATSATDSTTRIISAKNAANAFVDILQQRTLQPLHAASVTTISNDGDSNVAISLTRDMVKVHAAIDAITIKGGTCVECAIRNAMADFDANERNGVKNIAVMLTDGGATQSIGTKADGSAAGKAAASKTAFAAAMEAHKKFNMAFYTIGFGESVNDQLLINIATSSGGMYYFAPDGASLKKIYQNIAEIIGKGAVSGKVFNDTNANGVIDPDEDFLPDWTVNVVDQTSGNTAASAKSDSAGNFSIQGLCDGNYKVTETVKPGWQTTVPKNPDYYSIAISKGNSLVNKNFGNIPQPTGSTLTCSPADITLSDKPTSFTSTLKNSNGTGIAGKTITWTISGSGVQISPSTGTTDSNGNTSTVLTVANTKQPFSGKVHASFAGDTLSSAATCDANAVFEPQSTTISMNVLLHGIGSAGDNANTRDTSLSNKNPIHTSRRIEIKIYDTDNQLITTSSYDAVYNQTSGKFPVTRDIGSGFATGKYTILVSSPGYLTKKYPFTVTINSQQSNTLPDIQLITGDVDTNNTLNILDYDLVIGCYSDFAPPIACNQTEKDGTDINDDGKIEQSDYNLFLRELSVQNGDTVQQPNNP